MSQCVRDHVHEWMYQSYIHFYNVLLKQFGVFTTVNLREQRTCIKAHDSAVCRELKH